MKSIGEFIMGNLSIKEGTLIYQADTPLTHIACIIKGSISASRSYEEYTLHAGDVIGITDLCRGSHNFTYQAKEDSVIISYPLKDMTKLSKLLGENSTLAKCALSSSIRQICTMVDSCIFKQYECSNLYSFLENSYKEYKELCKALVVPAKTLPAMEEVSPYQASASLEPWMSGYYEDLKEMQQSHDIDAFLQHPAFLSGFLMKNSSDAQQILACIDEVEVYMSDYSTLLLNEDKLDFFDLYTSLYYRTLKDGKDNLSLSSTISTFIIHIQSTASIDSELARQRIDTYKEQQQSLIQEIESGQLKSGETYNIPTLEHSLDTILDYSGCSQETSLSFQRTLAEYKKVIDKNSTEADVKKLRLDLTEQFYEIYEKAFFHSLEEESIPTVVKMFFLFGYVDEELAGSEYSSYLYSIADSFKGSERLGVYTIYEWLKAIYTGKKEPRRNEFDVDYQSYVHELLVNKQITKQQEQTLLQDQKQKLLFEIKNLFPLTNKLTFGRIATFCPVFSEHNVIKDLEDALNTPDKLRHILEDIRTYDYSAFYRDELFFDSTTGVKETIQTEILPDIILMPNVGTRGIMWQEIEGKRRLSPATFVLPVFLLENPDRILIRLTGEFRYEMCKRTQGTRWNDVSDPSLTSEYCDYVQFYRKNSDLSPDAKEKLKLALTKARNSYKEMFVMDYLSWILFEAKGSPRLNKVARRILFTYCPFPNDIRAKLSANPLYREIMERWSIKQAQKKHKFENVCKKIAAQKKEVPDLLLKQQEFLNR